MADITDIFRNLTKTQKALLPFFQQQALTDKTASQILSDLKAEGVGIRRQSGLDLIAALRGNLKSGQQARLADDATILNPKNFGRSLTPLKADYSHQVAIRVRDPESGELSTIYRQVTTDTLLTKGQINNMALSRAVQNHYVDEDQIEAIDITESLANDFPF